VDGGGLEAGNCLAGARDCDHLSIARKVFMLFGRPTSERGVERSARPRPSGRSGAHNLRATLGRSRFTTLGELLECRGAGGQCPVATQQTRISPVLSRQGAGAGPLAFFVAVDGHGADAFLTETARAGWLRGLVRETPSTCCSLLLRIRWLNQIDFAGMSQGASPCSTSARPVFRGGLQLQRLVQQPVANLRSRGEQVQRTAGLRWPQQAQNFLECRGNEPNVEQCDRLHEHQDFQTIGSGSRSAGTRSISRPGVATSTRRRGAAAASAG